MNRRLNEYLSMLQPIRDPLLLKMKKHAAEHRIPIMEDASMEILLSLIKLKKPKKIFEIGAAIGYSAIRMAKAYDGCTVISCEIDKGRLSEAQLFLKESGLSDRIVLIHGDALELGGQIKKDAPFDFIFIDAAKGQYEKYFKLFAPMLAEHGVVVSDNVFFRGMVPGIEPLEKKFRTAVKRLRDYNAYLASHEGFETTFYPVGDGLAVSIKVN